MMNLDSQKVVVTGGTGFVGSHLVEALVRHGSKVRVLANYKSRPSIGHLEFLDEGVLDDVEVVWGDVTDRDSVAGTLRDATVVFHLAALIGIPYSYIAPGSYVHTNVTGTLNILQAARAGHIERVVQTSTSETYGSAQVIPMNEQHPLVAQSPYAASKIAADKMAESFQRSFDVPVVTVRPFNIFGPRQSDRAIIPTIIAQRVAGAKVVRIGNADPKRDFTFVTDTVAGFIRAAECDRAIGKTINLGNGKSISMGDLALRICELTGGGSFESQSTRTRAPASEVDELLCDNTLAGELLGWRPEVSLNEGLKRTIDFVRSHPDLYDPARYRV